MAPVLPVRKCTWIEVHLLYGVLEACDVITRSVLIKNTGSGNITIEKAHAACLDMVYGDYDAVSYTHLLSIQRKTDFNLRSII